LSISAFAATFTWLSARFVLCRISFGAVGSVGINAAPGITGSTRLGAGISWIAVLCRRIGWTAISALLGLRLSRATHLRSQLALGNDLLAGLLHRVGEIPHLGTGRLITLAESGRGVMRRFLKTISLWLHRL